MSATQGPRTPATDFTLEVRTELPQADYAALHALAEKKRTTVARLVAECVRRQLHVKPRVAYAKRRRLDAEDDDAIRRLSALGYSDSRIGREISLAPSTIHSARKRLGLPKRAVTGRTPSTPEGTP